MKHVPRGPAPAAVIYLVWLTIGLVWGTTWGVIRIGLTDLPPLTFAALRTGLAAVTLVSIANLVDRGRRPVGADLRFWLLMGIPQLGIPYALIFWAEQTITSSLTAILFATFPAFTSLAARTAAFAGITYADLGDRGAVVNEAVSLSGD